MAEIALAEDLRFSHFCDRGADGRTASVTDGDIPRHLVDVSTRMAEVWTASMSLRTIVRQHDAVQVNKGP
ncbi:hypothetical protein OSTOST_00312 [Ostertagia ostertagi]